MNLRHLWATQEVDSVTSYKYESVFPRCIISCVLTSTRPLPTIYTSRSLGHIYLLKYFFPFPTSLFLYAFFLLKFLSFLFLIINWNFFIYCPVDSILLLLLPFLSLWPLFKIKRSLLSVKDLFYLPYKILRPLKRSPSHHCRPYNMIHSLYFWNLKFKKIFKIRNVFLFLQQCLHHIILKSTKSY